jgi:hypothetical protein
MYRTVVISLLATLGLLGVIFAAIRRERLSVRYSLLWIFSGLGVLLFSGSRRLLDLLAEALGIFYPPSALFLLGTFFILVLLFHLTVVVSGLKARETRIGQELALLRRRLEELEGPRA